MTPALWTHLDSKHYNETKMISAKTKIVGNDSSVSLAAVFATPTTAALLSVFALYPEQVFIQRELVEMTAGSLYLVQRELKRLEHAGVILRRQWGRQVQYRVDFTQPAVAYLLTALLRSSALRDPLREALSGVAGVHLAFAFGTFVDGQGRAGGALEVAVAYDGNDMQDLFRAVAPVGEALGCAIKPVAITHERLRLAREVGNDSAVGVALDARRLWIVGDDDEFARWSELGDDMSPDVDD